jgi:hypothetical protein
MSLSMSSKACLKREVMAYMMGNPGVSTRAIAHELGEDLEAVDSALHELISEQAVKEVVSPKGHTRYLVDMAKGGIVKGPTRLVEGLELPGLTVAKSVTFEDGSTLDLPECEGDACTIGAPVSKAQGTELHLTFNPGQDPKELVRRLRK